MASFQWKNLNTNRKCSIIQSAQLLEQQNLPHSHFFCHRQVSFLTLYIYLFDNSFVAHTVKIRDAWKVELGIELSTQCVISEVLLCLTGCWSKIFDWFSKAYTKPLQPKAGLAIFGCSQIIKKTPATMQRSLELGMIVAKRLILQEWKSPVAPSSNFFLGLEPGALLL